MKNNQRNLIITIIGAVLIIAYLSILSLSRTKTAPNGVNLAPKFNLDALHTCLKGLNKMINDQEDYVTLKGKMSHCSLEMDTLLLKKTLDFLPTNINYELEYESLVGEKKTKISQDRDGIHVILWRSENLNYYRCSSNILDLTFSQKTISFIPRDGKHFIVCWDDQNQTEFAYYSKDFTFEELTETIDGNLRELKKAQLNLPSEPTAIDTSKMTPSNVNEQK